MTGHAKSGRSPCSRGSSTVSFTQFSLREGKGLAKLLADHPTDVSENARRPRGRGQTALSVDTDQHRPVLLGPRHSDVAERVLTVASSLVGNSPILGKSATEPVASRLAVHHPPRETF